MLSLGAFEMSLYGSKLRQFKELKCELKLKLRVVQVSVEVEMYA